MPTPPFAVLGRQRGLIAPVLISKPVPPRVLPLMPFKLYAFAVNWASSIERGGFAAAATTIHPNEAAVGNTQWFDGGPVPTPPFAVLGRKWGLKNASVLISKTVPPRVLPFN